VAETLETSSRYWELSPVVPDAAGVVHPEAEGVPHRLWGEGGRFERKKGRNGGGGDDRLCGGTLT